MCLDMEYSVHYSELYRFHVGLQLHIFCLELHSIMSNISYCLCTQHAHPRDSTRDQKVLQIIREVADVHINAASRAIQLSVAETMDEVTFVLDKASLPRPPELGIQSYNYNII